MTNVNFYRSAARGKPGKVMGGLVAALLVITIFFSSCTTYVAPNQVGIMESRVLPPTGIRPGLINGGRMKLVMPGQTIHLFPTDLQVLDLLLSTNAKETGHQHKEHPNHRIEAPVQVNTSDGSQVGVDVTVLYRIVDANAVIQQSGPGRLYQDNALIPKTVSAIKKHLGEMVAEDFYDVHKREPKQRAAQEQIAAELEAKGILVEHVVLRQYYYNPAYQAQIEEKKIQDQLKFTRQSEGEQAKELAKKQEIEATGKANVGLETQRGTAEVTKIQAEANAYMRKRHAQADLAVQLATAKGTELENAAFQGAGSENLVGMEMAEVLRGLDAIVIPSGGKGGMNPLDLDQSLEMFDVKRGQP